MSSMPEGQLHRKPVLCSYSDIGPVMLDNKHKEEDRNVMEGQTQQPKLDIGIEKGRKRCLETLV